MLDSLNDLGGDIRFVGLDPEVDLGELGEAVLWGRVAVQGAGGVSGINQVIPAAFGADDVAHDAEEGELDHFAGGGSVEEVGDHGRYLWSARTQPPICRTPGLPSERICIQSTGPEEIWRTPAKKYSHIFGTGSQGNRCPGLLWVTGRCRLGRGRLGNSRSADLKLRHARVFGRCFTECPGESRMRYA